MYTTRKGWPLESAEIRILPMREPPGPLDGLRLELLLHGPALTAEHRARIVDIASKCPVHRTLERPLHIETVEIPTR
jgi:putative redox protein